MQPSVRASSPMDGLQPTFLGMVLSGLGWRSTGEEGVERRCPTPRQASSDAQLRRQTEKHPAHNGVAHRINVFRHLHEHSTTAERDMRTATPQSAAWTTNMVDTTSATPATKSGRAAPSNSVPKLALLEFDETCVTFFFTTWPSSVLFAHSCLWLSHFEPVLPILPSSRASLVVGQETNGQRIFACQLRG